MRKLVLLTTMVALAAFVVLTAAPAAMAAALGPHQLASDNNPCKVCHDTASGTPALRGWNGGEPTAFGDWGSKPISALCSSCHDAVGGPWPGVQEAHNMVNTAYDYLLGSHGFSLANLPLTPDGGPQDAVTTTLPYTNAGGELECTSCHNVHVSTNRPFNQRADYQLMCEECHAGRNGTAAPGVSRAMPLPTGATRVYSTHPTDVSMGVTPANRTIDTVATMDATLRKDVDAIGNYLYALGGHLNGVDATGGGDVGPALNCQTCHAVHGPIGVPEDANGLPGEPNLLAIDNSTGANPGAERSALCEGCHGNVTDGTQVGTPTAPLPPGTFEEDHPMDLRDGFAGGVVAAIPGDWSPAITGDSGAEPFAPDSAGTNPLNTYPQPVCSSCHDTHGGIQDSMILRGPDFGTTPENFLPWTAASYDTWCFSCHTAGGVIPANHHSVYNNMNDNAVTAANPGGGSEMLSQLTCGDCHGSSAAGNWTAHNGFWSFPVIVSPTDSAFCEECHYYGDPTIPEAIATGVATFPKVAYAVDGAGRFATLPATHGIVRDVGTLAEADPGSTSHQTDIAADSGGASPNLVAVPDWSGYSGGISEWGPATTPICESCHNIITNGIAGDVGIKQGWQANLLLAPYEDDTNGAGAGEDGPTGTSHDFYGNNTVGAGPTGVAFCRACHDGASGAGGAGFVHNPSAHTVDYTTYTYPVLNAIPSQPYGRTTTTILTGGACPEQTTADAAGAPEAVSSPGVSYPGIIATNSIDCDSCHRPHNADAQSYDDGTVPTSALRGERFLILEITDENWGTTICAECHDTDIQCN